MKKTLPFKIVKTAIVAVAFICTSCGTNTVTDNGYKDLTSQMDNILSDADFNGVVLLSKGATVLKHEAVGYSNLETMQPLIVNDLFYIGSISKQITAVMVMQAVEKGSFKRTDTINLYLDDINQPWVHDVTIHHLLTHTHGIIALDKPLEFEVGSQFKYSQLGYGLLARILEKATAMNFEQLVITLFKENGLEHSFYPNAKKFIEPVKGYEENENGVLIYATNSRVEYPAAGGFIATAADLNRWNHLLHSGKLVSANALTLMKTKYAVRDHTILGNVNYGYGLLFKDKEPNIEIGTMGYVPGFVSISYYYPQSDMSLVVLQNTAHDLDDFSKTFKVPYTLMQLVKRYSMHD